MAKVYIIINEWEDENGREYSIVKTTLSKETAERAFKEEVEKTKKLLVETNKATYEELADNYVNGTHWMCHTDSNDWSSVELITSELE